MAKHKIFIVHPSDWLTDHMSIGDGLVAHGFLNELAKRGHEIHIAARMAELATPFPPNVTIHMIKQTVTLRPFDRLEYMLRVRRLFRRLDKAIHFDLAHQMNPVFAGLSLCLLGYKLPLVLGTYIPDWPDDPDAVTSGRGLTGTATFWIKKTICTFQQKQAAAFLITSPPARARVFLGKEADSRVYHMEHGIDTEYFSPPASGTSFKTTDPSILFLSNIGKKKGIFVLLEAFSEILRSVPDCRLTIAGGGAELDQIRDIISANGWETRVSVLGRIHREEAAELYRSHSVYTLPSFGEPYGMTMVEAMGCGSPVVATDSGGIPFLILPDGGLAVPPRQSGPLAQAIVHLLQNPQLAQHMGRRNRERVVALNTWSAVVNSLEAVYEDVLSKSIDKRHSTNNRELPSDETAPTTAFPSTVAEDSHV